MDAQERFEQAAKATHILNKIFEKARKEKKLRGRAYDMYVREVGVAGRSSEDACELVLEQFADEGLTERKLRNIISRKVQMQPSDLAKVDERIARALDRAEDICNDVVDVVDKELDELDEAEDNGEKWCEVSEESTTGGKFDGAVKTIKTRIDERRNTLVDRKAKAIQRFAQTMNDLGLIVKRTQLDVNMIDQYSNEELSQQRDALRAKIEEAKRRAENTNRGDGE